MEDLNENTKSCDFVFHLAGVNRSVETEDYMSINTNLTQLLLSLLRKHNNKCPVLFSSSSQAENDTPYGVSKEKAEEFVFSHADINESPVFVYRLTNIFGKWSKPNYNSVVATFCYNIARGKEIIINDANHILTLCHIDDVMEEFIECTSG